MSDILVVPSVKVYPDKIVEYLRYENLSKCKSNQDKSLVNLKRNIHRNRLSTSSEKKIKRTISYIDYISREQSQQSNIGNKSITFRLTFVTLTLSSAQVHSDNHIKSTMLNQFLIEARKRWRVDTYIWRQEKQINGNIHFHLLTNRFIPHAELRNVWNRIQEKEKYITRYTQSMQEFHSKGFNIRRDLVCGWDIKRQRKAYEYGCRTNWANPNSTDVHSLKHIRNAASYICKYMTKDEQHRRVSISRSLVDEFKIEGEIMKGCSVGALKFLRMQAQTGRLWGCSENLSKANGITVDSDSFIEKELKVIQYKSVNRIYSDDYCKVIYVDMRELGRLDVPIIKDIFRAHIFDKFGITYQLSMDG